MTLNYDRSGVPATFASKLLESAQIPKFEIFRVKEMVLTPPPTLLQNKNIGMFCPSGKMQIIWTMLNESHRYDADAEKAAKTGRKRKYLEISNE